MSRDLAYWTLADCLRELRRRRYWWAIHVDLPLEMSLREWWDREAERAILRDAKAESD